MSAVATKVDEAAIMAVLEDIPDPEIPVLTITDLGIVRGFVDDPPRVRISPTYTGCPATVAIEMSIREALDNAGFADVHIEARAVPAVDHRLDQRARARTLAGVRHRAAEHLGHRRNCPQCGSTDTEEVSRFGSTPCKAQWRCQSCLEPFDRFKCH